MGRQEDKEKKRKKGFHPPFFCALCCFALHDNVVDIFGVSSFLYPLLVWQSWNASADAMQRTFLVVCRRGYANRAQAVKDVIDAM